MMLAINKQQPKILIESLTKVLHNGFSSVKMKNCLPTLYVYIFLKPFHILGRKYISFHRKYITSILLVYWHITMLKPLEKAFVNIIQESRTMFAYHNRSNKFSILTKH